MHPSIMHTQNSIRVSIAAGIILGSLLLWQGTASAQTIDRELDIGDTGIDVTELQEFLAQDPALYPEGLVTGYFGPLTQDAVERFQVRQGIVATGTPTSTGFGRVGPATQAEINALIGNIGGPGTPDAGITQRLDLGDQGPNVTRLQQFLAQDPTLYPSGLITGFYGPLTQDAVERFQIRQGIVFSGTPATTGFGRVGPETLSEINALIGNVGGPGTPGNGSNGNGTDDNAPIMSSPATVVTTRNTATISWTTSEPARSRVLYGTSWPFLYATAPSGSDQTLGTGTTITLTGLQPNTTYYFVRESTDAAGNVMLTTERTFQTNP